MTTYPYSREARDALAEKLFVAAMAQASNLGHLTPGEQEGIYDQVADLALAMANRFQARACATPA
jgi:hypothetical protein